MKNDCLGILAARNIGWVALLGTVELKLTVSVRKSVQTYAAKTLLQLTGVGKRQALTDPDDKL